MLIICLLLGAVYFLVNNSDNLRDQVLSFLHVPQQSVKAASTKRGQEISNQLKSQLGNGINSAEKQIMNLKISDAVSLLSHAQKIPVSMGSIQSFLTQEFNTYAKKK